GIVSVRLRYEGPLLPHAAEELLDHLEKDIRARAGNHIFASSDETLAGAIVAELRSRGKTVSSVESCTGGLLGGALTEVSGSSAVFTQGWVTYTNVSKHREVDVPAALLNLGPQDGEAPRGPGAVSAEVAGAMAVGGLTKSGSTYCLSVTGIAGPTGGTPEKAVGTVYIGLAKRVAGGQVITDIRLFQMAGD